MSESLILPSAIKLFPIRGCILPPGEHLPLNVFEPRYLNMTLDAMGQGRLIGMVQPKPAPGEDLPRDPDLREAPDVFSVGCMGRIVSFAETGDDGRKMQERLVATAREVGVRLIGPNSMGVIHPASSLTLSVNAVLEMEGIKPGGMSLISQSGTILGTLLSRGAARGAQQRPERTAAHRAGGDHAIIAAPAGTAGKSDRYRQRVRRSRHAALSRK